MISNARVVDKRVKSEAPNHHNLPSILAGKVMRSVVSVRPSFRLFSLFLLNQLTNYSHCVWVIAIARRERRKSSPAGLQVMRFVAVGGRLAVW